MSDESERFTLPDGSFDDDAWREAHGAPSLDDLMLALGENAAVCWDFELSLKRVRWFRRVGKPHRNDARVVRVRSWEEANLAAWLASTDAVQEPAWDEVSVAAPAALLEAAEGLFIYYATSDYPTELNWAIRNAAVGALRETASRRLHGVTFFRDQWPWFRAGHWPCGVDDDGRLIVF